MVLEKSAGNRAFNVVNYALLGAYALITVLPFINILASSFSTAEELYTTSFLLFPKTFTLAAYKYILSTNTLMRSMFNSIFITVAGTLVNLFFTVTLAYPLAHKTLRGRRPLLLMVTFTMMFNGGMIPTYLVVRSLKMINSFSALIFPLAINAFNLMVMRNFFQALPGELEESARLDGCNDLTILLRIILPISLPSLASMTLFYAVAHWNRYFTTLLYINDSAKWPVQVLLRQMVMLSEGGLGNSDVMDDLMIPPEATKCAVIIFSTLPILLFYPFLQKYFVSGLLVGSLKG